MIPKEVSDYFEHGRRKATHVEPLSDYRLLVTFNSGEKRVCSMPPRTGVLSILNDAAKYRECFVDEAGNIAWDIDNSVDSAKVWSNRIDLCADSLYIYGKPV